MGWIKKLFKKKEIEKQTIKLDESEAWLDSKTLQAIDSLNSELAGIISGLKQTVNTLKSQINALENAEITHKGHIENKVRAVVLGHRKNYIRLLSHFIDSLNFPDEVNYRTAMGFYSSTLAALNKFSTGTIKTFYTVQHLFHKEVNDIAKTIKQFDKTLNEIKSKIEKNNIHLIDTAKSKIKLLGNEIKEKEEITKTIEEKKKKLISSKESRLDYAGRLEKMKKSREYLDLKQLNEDKAKIEDELNSIETGLIQMFSPVEHALKKYHKIALEDEDIIEKYIENPVEALLSDEDLRIFSIFHKMKSSILSGSIELKDRKKEKTLETIDKIDKDKLDAFLDARKSILEKKEQIKTQISKNTSPASIKEIEYKTEHVTNLIKKLKSDIEETEKNLSRIDIEKTKSELEENLKKITNIEVNVVF